MPLMTRPSNRIVDPPRPEGVELLTPSTDEELRGATAAQSEAFGGPPLSGANAERMRATIAAGGIAVAARELATGTIVGAGVCTPPADEVAELAGIGVQAAHRRRGIAGALRARLAQEAFTGRGHRGVPHAGPRRSGAGLRARGLRVDVTDAAHLPCLTGSATTGLAVSS